MKAMNGNVDQSLVRARHRQLFARRRQGRDWKSACADAERANKSKPLRVLTHKDLRSKGIGYSRQHIARRVAANTFPAPFNLPDEVT
jgi:hypothetical protein